MTKKFLLLTKYEWEVVVLFALAILINVFWLHLPVIQICSLYVLGMSFEFATHGAWTYNPALKDSPFSIPSIGANWIFGLGWVGNIVTSIAFGTWLGSLLGLTGVWMAIIGVGILGNIWERLFLLLQLWTYNPKHWIVNLWTSRPQLSDHGVPWAVTLGYPVMGFGVWYALKGITFLTGMIHV